MRNLLLIATFSIFLTSCAGNLVEVRLLKSNQISLFEDDHDKGRGKDFLYSHDLFGNIEVVDNRLKQDLIGIKQYGKEEVEIINNQDLADLIKDKITENLKKNSQFIDQDKTLTIALETLKYDSRRGFLLGKSKAKITFKASLIDNGNDHMEYRRIYNLENERTHFIISLEKTDQRTIDTTLRNAVDTILKERNLQDVLIDQNHNSTDER